MKLIAPDYYRDFRCIAGACRHTCCKGWEIDIDAESYARFRNCPGEIGERLRANMAPSPPEEESPAHFVLQGAEERCPFLNGEGLCDLILTLGEESLCQICTDHPRFRSYWSGRTEIGLGMACEEAARLILSRREKVTLAVLEDDGEPEEVSEEEAALLAFRDHLTDILQDRSRPTDERVRAMLAACAIPSDAPDVAPGPLDEIACEQLAVYLLYRHFADVIYDGRLEERVRFTAESYRRVRNAWAENGSTEIEAMVEIARAFSEDVEYDTETWG